jgi:hypothetical protein
MPGAICTEWGHGASRPVDGAAAPHVARHSREAFLMCQDDPYTETPAHNGVQGGHAENPWCLRTNRTVVNRGKRRRG